MILLINYQVHCAGITYLTVAFAALLKVNFLYIYPGLILSIPYGASMGGIATLTGTPPNLVFKQNFEKFYANGPTVDFGKWMAFCYPISFLLVVVGWHVLVLMYARSRLYSLV